MNADERLERIEARQDRTKNDLEDVRTLLIAVAEVAERNRGDIDRLVSVSLESRRDIELLADRVGDVAQVVSELREITNRQAEQAERDRAAWQAEIRRIWEYLLGQQGNGDGRR